MSQVREGNESGAQTFSDAGGYRDQLVNRKLLIKLILVVIILLALALRIHNLDGQSIWSDEGLSIYRARQSIPTILANTITIDDIDTRDMNPPLYFLILHLWRITGGESIFNLRYLSALTGVLSVALVYQIGRRSFNQLVGVGAAFLLALSPFHVWMSQEIRNYTLLLFFNLLSVYGLFRYASEPGRSGSWRWLVLWGAAAVTGIYTHFFGALVFAYGVVALGGLWLSRMRRQRRVRPARWLVIALIIVGLITLPVLWLGYSRLRVSGQIDFVFVPIQHLTSHALSVFSVGLIQTVVQPLWRVIPAVILAIFGAVAGWFANRKSERRAMVPLILGYLFLPFLLLFALSTVTPIYNGPRHLLISLPPYLLLIAAGIVLPWTMSVTQAATRQAADKKSFWLQAGLWRVVVTVLGIWLVISQGTWLYTQFTSDALIKDDFQGLAEYLGQVAQEDDLIVLHDTISGPIFDYYYDGPAEWVAIPAFWQSDGEKALAELRTAGDSVKRIWFVSEPTPRTGFPRQLLDEWASENWPAFMSTRFPWLWLRIKLDGYVPEPVIDQLPPGVVPSASYWGDELQLHGFEAPQSGRAGDYWQPTLYWSKQEADPEGYHLSYRWTDDIGQVWAQIDQPLWQQYPPGEWPDGALVRYQPVLQMPAGLPPGDYQVRLRVNRESDRQPLLADGAVEIVLSPSMIVEAAVFPDDNDALPPYTPVNVVLGGQIEIAGFSEIEGEYKPGHVVPIDVLWRVRQTPAADYVLQTQLLNSQGEVVSENRTAPSRSNYPPTSWQVNQYLSGRAGLVVPATAEAGDYIVRLSLLDPESLDPLRAGWRPGSSSVELGSVTVAPWPFETDLPSIPNSFRADFGQPPLIEFHGYDLAGLSVDEASPGDNLELTLFWRSLSDSITTSYSVLVHLTDETGEIVAQGDGRPAGGFRPTTSWRQGEVIIDTHQLSIPAGAQAGTYSLWVGLYNPETFERLPALHNGQRQADDRLLIDKIRVSP